MDLIAEGEGVEPQQHKKWSKILDAFSALAFAIAPLHSTFIQQIDGASCHPACLLTLHCALSRRVVKDTLQVPQDTCPGVPSVVAASAANTRRGVWICRKWCVVPPQYPHGDGQLRNDQAFCTELQGELKTALFWMCTNNPTVRRKPRHADNRRVELFSVMSQLWASERAAHRLESPLPKRQCRTRPGILGQRPPPNMAPAKRRKLVTLEDLWGMAQTRSSMSFLPP